MRAYVLDFDANDFTAYASKGIALQHAQSGQLIVTAADDLFRAKSVTIDDMAGFYAANDSGGPARFKSRAIAASRLFALLKASSDANPEMIGDASRDEPAADRRKPGRTHKYAGYRLFASPAALRENPRREGTRGWQHMEIMRAAGRQGITWEDYAALAGEALAVSIHTDWDVKHGHMTVLPPSAQQLAA